MKQRTINTLLGCLAGVLLSALPSQAGMIGPIGAPGDPGVGECMPFGCSDASTYQQIFDQSLFAGPTTIAGITFFLRNFDNIDPLTGGQIVPNEILAANYTILFSVVSTPVDGLDPTVDNNIDPSTAQTFFIGNLSGPVNDSFTIFTAAANYFAYDPSQGNLLMDIRTDSTDLSLTLFLDFNSASGGLFSSAFDSNPHPGTCPDGSVAVTTGCTDLDRGLVVGFATDGGGQGTTPEPATLLFVAGGLLLSGVRYRRHGIS